MEETKNESKGNMITIKKHTLWQVGTFIFAALFVVSLFTGGFSGSNAGVTGAAVGAPTNPTPTPIPEPSNVQVSVDDDAVLGNKDAKVTIIEFSDYQCPFCGRFWSDTLPQIKSQYIDTKKVKLVYRDFPLTSIHPNAQPAAEAVECVRYVAKGSDEAYFKMHDKIFQNQQALSTENLKAWAKELGYDITSCLDSGKFRSEVQKDSSDGQSAGVQGTPAFFINGKLVSGAQPFSVFKQAIDAEL